MRKLVAEQAWMERAACRGADPGLFVGEASRALVICESCVVRAACLSFALDHPEVVGVWGATTERQRRTLRRSFPVGNEPP